MIGGIWCHSHKYFGGLAASTTLGVCSKDYLLRTRRNLRHYTWKFGVSCFQLSSLLGFLSADLYENS